MTRASGFFASRKSRRRGKATTRRTGPCSTISRVPAATGGIEDGVQAHASMTLRRNTPDRGGQGRWRVEGKPEVGAWALSPHLQRAPVLESHVFVSSFLSFPFLFNVFFPCSCPRHSRELCCAQIRCEGAAGSRCQSPERCEAFGTCTVAALWLPTTAPRSPQHLLSNHFTSFLSLLFLVHSLHPLLRGSWLALPCHAHQRIPFSHWTPCPPPRLSCFSRSSHPRLETATIKT